MRKHISIALLLSAALLILPCALAIAGTDVWASVYTAETEGAERSVVTGGPFGSGTAPTGQVQYVLYSDGTMEVTGTGATFSCGWDGADQPFYEYRDQIRYLIIGEGITQIQKGAFAFLPNLESVSFPDSLMILSNNCFTGSFTESCTGFTIPASVIRAGGFLVGRSYGSGAAVTDIYIENPNINLDASTTPLNGSADLSTLRLYSYGKDNSVSAYAAAIGCKYVDLNTYFTGETGGLFYELDGTVLTLSAREPGITLSAGEQPWLAHIEASRITELTLEPGFSAIGDYAFADYSSLRSAVIGEGVRTLGTGAFSVTSGEAPLTVKLPHSLDTIGGQVFGGRGKVLAEVYYDTPASRLAEPNVQLHVVRRMNLLLLGNSYSHDAVNYGYGMTDSQLLTMLQSMLGEDGEITIAAAYSAASTMAWHATQAELGTGQYTFYSIGSDHPQWRWEGMVTAAQALAWTDWDAVILQPYGQESFTGINEPIQPEQEADKFGTLEAASEFMLDYVAQRVPDAKVYYYMIWRRTRELALNAGLDLYEPLAAVTAQVMDYAGPQTGRQFTDVIPAGAAIQFARSTYLALLSYNPTAHDEGDLSLETDPQIGLQRDSGHVTLNVGRYIVSRTVAETVVPAQMRVADYALPDIRVTESVGRLPREYTEIAAKAVDLALASWRQTEDRLAVTTIEGYAVDPAVKASEMLSGMTLRIDGSLEAAAVESAVAEAVLAVLDADLVLEDIAVADVMSVVPGQPHTGQVTIRFGYTTVTAGISFEVTQPVYEKTVVPPTCTEAGYTLYTFSTGGTSSTDYVAAVGHSFLDGLCLLCGEVKKELLPGGDGCFYYYERDRFRGDFTGFVDNGIALWYAENGRVRLDYAGLVTVDGQRYYIRSGFVSSYTGLKKLDGTWLYLADGRVDTGCTGLVAHNGTLVYVENGEVDFSVTDAVEFDGTLYYIRCGIWAHTYEGLVKGSDGVWRYMRQGMFCDSYTGLAKNTAGWWYTRDGLVDCSFTGLGANHLGLWYVKDGQAVSNFSGLVKHDGDYWYVKNGLAMLTHTGVVAHNGGFFYVKDGKADFTYTGIYTNGDGVIYNIVKGVATPV